MNRLNKRSIAKGGESALLFNSGFQANAAILSALLDESVWGRPILAYCDKLNHGSMHYGLKAAGVRQIRYRHNDLNHLETLLQKQADQQAVRFIITESVFSMDGDESDIDALIALARQYGAFLYVDDAHATGMMGVNGFGLCAHKDVDFKMGTFSKAMGGFGAYLVCSQVIRDYLINRAGGFVYSTGLPPSVLGAMDAALDLVPQKQEARDRVVRHSMQVRDAARACGLDVGPSTTQIIPLILGDEDTTLSVTQKLEERDILAIAIRPPTVPPNGSRIRLAITADHTQDDIDRLCAALKDCSV